MAGMEDHTVIGNQHILPMSVHSNSLGLYAIQSSASFPIYDNA